MLISSLKTNTRNFFLLSSILLISACGFTPVYQNGALAKVSVYMLEVTGDNARAFKEQLQESIIYSDTARLSLSVKVKEFVFEENIDRFREAARETLRTTVTYTIYDRETNQSTSGSFTEQTSYTLSDSEISSQLEQATARSTISQSVQARIQNELLKANKTKWS